MLTLKYVLRFLSCLSVLYAPPLDQLSKLCEGERKTISFMTIFKDYKI